MGRWFEKTVERAPAALVFSGGGAKGSFEIGAWRAFREMGLEFDAVVGASVGSLNAALYAQGDYDLAEEIWSTVSIEQVVEVPRNLVTGGKIDLKGLDLSNIAYFNRTLFKKRGLDSTPLYNLLKTSVDETAIRKGGVDLGIVTIEVKGLKPLEIFLDRMEEGSLADYLLASASFPAFEDAEFNGKKFTDGGMYNNIPHSMVRDRGYRDIVVVDVSGMGMNRRPDVEGTRTAYVKNSLTMGGVLDFSPQFLKDYRELGYLDTLRTFSRLEGVNYHLKPQKGEDRKLLSGVEDPEIRRRFLSLIPDEEKEQDFEKMLRSLLPKEYAQRRDLAGSLTECAALSLNIPRNRLYTREELQGAIRDSLSKIDQAAPLAVEQHIKRAWKTLGEALWKNAPQESDSGASSYEYALRAGLLMPGKYPPLVLKTYALVNQPLAGAILYGLITS